MKVVLLLHSFTHLLRRQCNAVVPPWLRRRKPPKEGRDVEEEQVDISSSLVCASMNFAVHNSIRLD